MTPGTPSLQVAAIDDGKTPPGRCIFCDQRCDASAIYHGYCLEEHLRNQAGGQPLPGLPADPQV